MEPSREGLLAAFTELQQNISGIVSGIPAYATASLLPAVTTADNGKQARVYADSTAANNTFWIVQGGAWVIDTSYAATLTGAVQPLVDDAQSYAGFNLRSDALTFAPKMASGDQTTVRQTDTGTHAAVAGEYRLDGTAATVGEAIPNEGVYTWNGTALLRTGSTQRQLGELQNARFGLPDPLNSVTGRTLLKSNGSAIGSSGMAFNTDGIQIFSDSSAIFTVMSTSLQFATGRRARITMKFRGITVTTGNDVAVGFGAAGSRVYLTYRTNGTAYVSNDAHAIVQTLVSGAAAGVYTAGQDCTLVVDWDGDGEVKATLTTPNGTGATYTVTVPAGAIWLALAAASNATRFLSPLNFEQTGEIEQIGLNELGAEVETNLANTESYIGADLSTPNEYSVGEFGFTTTNTVNAANAYSNYVAMSGKPSGVDINVNTLGVGGKLLQVSTSGVVLASVSVNYNTGNNSFGETALSAMVDNPSWYMFFEPQSGGGRQNFATGTVGAISFALSQSHGVGDTVTFLPPSPTAMLAMRVYATAPTILERLEDIDANVAGTNGAVATLTAQVAALSAGGQFRETVFADTNGIQGSGQSLVVAVLADPGLTTTQPFANVMLANGEHDFSAAGDLQGITGAPTSTSLAPLVYTKIGESIGVGGANMVKSQLVASGGPNVDFAWSNNGRGGQAIANINKGTNYYNWGLQQQALLKSLSNAQGKSYVQRAIWWMQGEADASGANNTATYKAALKQYLTDWNADLPQTHVVPLLTYQMASHSVRGAGTTWVPPNIAQAQLEASLEDDNIFLVCPMYFVPYNADNVHLTNHSTRWIGQYFAKVDHIVNTLGLDWKPLHPIACRRQGAIIDVDFHVPVGQLVFDTTLVSAATNYGFTAVRSSNGAALTVSSVALRGKTGVRIVLSADPGEDVRVRYAWGAAGMGSGPTTGARGNLRDQDATVSYYTNASSQPYPLQNWCVIFEMVSGGY